MKSYRHRSMVAFVVLAWCCLPGAALAGACPAGAASASCLTLADLRRLGLDELERLFAQAPAGPQPLGGMAGKVLLLSGTRCPRVAAGLVNFAWKGKVFAADGAFVNQWLGLRAIAAEVQFAPSWYDDRPAWVMEYAPGTPVLGNVRDEVREVAPGLYLGRLYQRCPCPRFLGFFVLQTKCP